MSTYFYTYFMEITCIIPSFRDFKCYFIFSPIIVSNQTLWYKQFSICLNKK